MVRRAPLLVQDQDGCTLLTMPWRLVTSGILLQEKKVWRWIGGRTGSDLCSSSVHGTLHHCPESALPLEISSELCQQESWLNPTRNLAAAGKVFLVFFRLAWSLASIQDTAVVPSAALHPACHWVIGLDCGWVGSGREVETAQKPVPDWGPRIWTKFFLGLLPNAIGYCWSLFSFYLGEKNVKIHVNKKLKTEFCFSYIVYLTMSTIVFHSEALE